MNSQEILKYFLHKDFVQDLKQQLIKDIEGAEVALDAELLSFEQLYALLLPVVESKFKDKTQWMRMINRVDLNERQLKNLGTMEGTYTEKMTKAIILREFQKIGIRWSNKK
jgi:hypothetical protein